MEQDTYVKRTVQQDWLFANLCTFYGCKPVVSGLIARGTTFPPTANIAKPNLCYVCGPMRGYPEYNFPAFDDARNRLVGRGWAAISPADIDRAAGLDEKADDTPITAEAEIKKFIYRDFFAIHYLSAKRGDSLFVLPGWEWSTGCAAEVMLAKWSNLPIREPVTGQCITSFDTAAWVQSFQRYLAAKVGEEA